MTDPIPSTHGHFQVALTQAQQMGASSESAMPGLVPDTIAVMPLKYMCKDLPMSLRHKPALTDSCFHRDVGS